MYPACSPPVAWYARAGALLAEVGPLDASTIVFSKRSQLATPQALSSRLPSVRISKAARRKAADSSTSAMLAVVLPVLAEYLIDAEAGVIQSTQMTLRQLLKLKEAVAALDQLDPSIRRCLEIFRKVCANPLQRGGHFPGAGRSSLGYAP